MHERVDDEIGAKALQKRDHQLRGVSAVGCQDEERDAHNETDEHSAYSTQLMIPFLKRFRPDLVIHSFMHSPHFWPLAFVPFLVFVCVVIVGSSNAVILTDVLYGLDIDSPGCATVALTVQS